MEGGGGWQRQREVGVGGMRAVWGVGVGVVGGGVWWWWEGSGRWVGKGTVVGVAAGRASRDRGWRRRRV